MERQNRSILKRLKIAHLEKKDLTIELAKYLLLYHNTLHSTTGKSLAELMINRKLRDKLSAIAQLSPWFEEIKEADGAAKYKGRISVEERRGVSSTPINVGDDILLPSPKLNKLSPSFDPEPFRVVESASGEVVVQRGSQVFRRSSSSVKVVLKPPSTTAPELPAKSEVPCLKSTESQPSAVEASDSSDTCTSAPSKGTPVKTRSGRTVKPPSRLSF